MPTSSSPWSRDASSTGTLPSPSAQPAPPPPPPPAPTSPPVGVPGPVGSRPPRPRRVPWLLVGLALLLVVVVSAAVGSTVTYLAMRGDHAASTSPSPAAQPPTGSPSSAPAAPQFSPADAAAAKDHLCQAFDVSVRGQEGQGGLRVQGNLNVPVVLRALNSASAVQNALVPAVPPDVAAAARKYVATTLDQTTAAMGNTPTSEVNRLTDVRNDAMYTLLDVCGLPR
jgi:hypothetical protein